MILYHGSTVKVTKIDLELSMPNKDFGKGFYLSDSLEQANEMALLKSSLLEDATPVVSSFDFDKEGLMNDKNLKIKIFEEYTEDWADFIFLNRLKSEEPKEIYDYVYGSIANDKVGRQINKFKDGEIDKSEFLHRLKYMKGITFQYYFGTEKSLKFLKPVL